MREKVVFPFCLMEKKVFEGCPPGVCRDMWKKGGWVMQNFPAMLCRLYVDGDAIAKVGSGSKGFRKLVVGVFLIRVE